VSADELSTPVKRCVLLTEQEVARSWQSVFRLKGVTEEAFCQAERLLEELRQESPLWHRLNAELHELRELKRPKRKTTVAN
jgi:hypothetical protein